LFLCKQSNTKTSLALSSQEENSCLKRKKMPRERKLINRLKPSKLTQISLLLVPFSARQTANISITISSRTIILNRTKIQDQTDLEFRSFLKASRMPPRMPTPPTLLKEPSEIFIKHKVLVPIKRL